MIHRMSKRLSDLPLRTLRKILRETERVVGPESVSIRILRRTIAFGKRKQGAPKARVRGEAQKGKTAGNRRQAKRPQEVSNAK